MACIDSLDPEKGEKPYTLELKDEPYSGAAPGDRALLKRAGNFFKERKSVHLAVKGMDCIKRLPKPDLQLVRCSAGIAILAYLLIICAVFVEQGFTGGWEKVDIKLYSLLVFIPVFLFALSLIISLIFASSRRSKTDSIVKETHDQTAGFRDKADSFTEEIRSYLNAFITVFYNEHFRLKRIARLNSNRRRLEKLINQRVSEMKEIDKLAGYTDSMSADYNQTAPSEGTRDIKSKEECGLFLQKRITPPECTGSLSYAFWNTTGNPWIHSLSVDVMRGK